MTYLLEILIRWSPLVFPTYFIRFQLAGVPLTALEIFCYFLSILWILSLLTKKIKWQMNSSLKSYYFAVFLIFLGATIGMLLAPPTMPGPQGAIVASKNIAMGIWKGWVVAPLLYFLVLTQTIHSKKAVRDLLMSLLYTSAMVSIMAFGWALWSNGLTSDGRLSGFYESANYLALYLIPGLLAGGILVIQSIQLQNKLALDTILQSLAIIITSVALLLSKSYAGILAVFGAIFFTLLYRLIHRPKHRTTLLKIISGAGIIFALIILSQWNTSKFQQFIDFENRSSSSVRLELYETSWGLLKQHPYKGLGPGLFQAHYHDQVHPILGHFPMEWNLPHPHNIFLGFWFNAGLLGLIGFLWLLALVHKKFTYALVPMWGILLHGLFDMPFWKNDLAMIFWVILACIIVLQTQKTTKKV